MDLLSDKAKLQGTATQLHEELANLLSEFESAPEGTWRVIREVTRSCKPARSDALSEALLLMLRRNMPASTGARVYAHLMLMDLDTPASMKVLGPDKALRDRNPQEWLDFVSNAVDPAELDRFYLELAPKLSADKIARRLKELRKLYGSDFFRNIRQTIMKLPVTEQDPLRKIYRTAYMDHELNVEVAPIQRDHLARVPALEKFYDRANA